jgi:hypothetical protein
MLCSGVFFSSMKTHALCEPPRPIDQAFMEQIQKETISTAKGHIQNCIDIFDKKRTKTSDDIYCSLGEFSRDSDRALIHETIAYQVAVSVAFSKIDEYGKKFLTELQGCRSQDTAAWNTSIANAIFGY